MTGVNAALTELLRNAEVFGGAKLVYWYSQDVKPEQDPMRQLFAWDEDDDFSFFDDDDPEPEEDAINAATRPFEAEAEVKKLLQSVENGQRPAELPDARYYILPVSGMSGRMMVRGWYEGRFKDLYDNILQWYDDLRLTLPGSRGDAKLPKLKRLCIVLLKPGGDPARVFDRMDKELAALLNRMFSAVVNGTPLPDAVASRALYTLRSRLMDSGSDDERQRSARPPLAIYQLLKCWLVRRQRERGEVLMEKQLKLDYPGVAYQCGRLMAVYAAIQQAAMGRDLGTGVVERYYGAAIVSPRFVLGSLSRLSNYHLSKIENPDHAMRYRRMLNEISTQIAPGSIPRLMTMEQQTEFALGYYQQNAAIYTKAPETKD